MADPTSHPEVKSPEFWRRTPPALFPAVFGLFGLGLAWRAAAVRFDGYFSDVIGEAILICVCILYLFCLSCYISKLLYRYEVLFEDITSPPGRAGAATMTLCLFLLSATLVPYAPLLAHVFLWTGLVLHFLMAACAIFVMSQQDRGLKVTPAWHLSFVGFIIAPLAAVPLGALAVSSVIFAVTSLAALVIYAVSLLQFSKEDVPAPARPLLMVHLAPVSLFATITALLGWVFLSFAFVVLAVGVGAVLASRYDYLTAAGFSPLWGAFTFPVAALASAIFTVSQNAPALGWLGLVPLLITSVLTPFIALRVLMMWANGTLARKTGASMA